MTSLSVASHRSSERVEMDAQRQVPGLSRKGGNDRTHISEIVHQRV